ncbi:MAG: FecR domain-containing protein [Nitrospinae bacterium]|nr:FecR domain-containing protein [Nitrospinota bacterium]
MKRMFAWLLPAFLLLIPGTAFAADFTAEIVDLDGKVTVTQKAAGKATPAQKGMKLVPGDVLATATDAEAELLYEDGNVTRVGEETTLTIKELSIADDKSRKTVLDLAAGQLKNSVSKLVSKTSSFEVHTKSAVAGVTGTPPWVVKAIGGKAGGAQRTEVDLITGTSGQVFVKGIDPAAPKVFLTPGTRTMVLFGMPPAPPSPISPARLAQLQKAMPITTPPETMQQKRQELDIKTGIGAEPPPASGEGASATPEAAPEEPVEPAKAAAPATAVQPPAAPVDTMLDHVAKNISITTFTPPADSTTGENSEQQGVQAGNITTTQTATQMPATTKVHIQLNLQTK